ncbi:MAG: O-antigen ligase family protein [Anaerolineae bacterium]|nr:O-antigen ligase family protein [Anaerolineae bacterium]
MFPVFFLLGIALLIVPTMRLPALGLSPSDVFIFAAFGWLTLEALLRPRERRAVIPIHVLWISAMLILIGGSIASVGALAPLRSFWQTVKVWFVLAPWVSMGMVMVQRGYLKHILYVFVFAGGITGGVAIFDLLTGIRVGAKISGVDMIFWNRETGTFGHPSTLGYFTCVAFPVAFGLLMDEWQNRRRVWLCAVWGAATLLLLGAMFISGSVTAWLATMIAFAALAAIWLVRAGSWVRWSMTIVGLALLTFVGGIVTLDLVPDNLNQVIERNLLRATVVTGPIRLNLLAESFELLDHDPFIGGGMDQTGVSSSEESQLKTSEVIHNTIISGWLNGGLLTFVGLIMAYAIAVLTAWRGLVYGAGHRNWVVLTLSAASLAWVVFDQTQPQLSQRFTWLTVSLLFGLGFGIQWVPDKKMPSGIGDRPAATRPELAVTQGKAGAGK